MQNAVAEGWTQRGKGICPQSECLALGWQQQLTRWPQRAQKHLASPGMGQGQDHSCRQLHPSALCSYMSPDRQKGWNAAKLHC